MSPRQHPATAIATPERRERSGAPVAGDASPLEAGLRSLVDRARSRPDPTLVSCTVPVPRRDPIELFAAARSLGLDPALWLAPAERFALVGIGAAWAVRPTGPGRFREAAAAWTSVARGALVSGDAPGQRGAGPLLLGGFAFAPESRRNGAAWSGFDSAALVLPRLLFTVSDGNAWLTASAVVEPGNAGSGAAGRIVAGLESAWAELDRAGVSVPLTPAVDMLQATGIVPEAAWQAAVIRLAGAVGRGRVDKVVLARQVEVSADAPIDVPAVLRRLEASAPESTVFAFSRGPRTFLGATPERLVRTDGRDFRTVAMAGSIGRGSDEEDDARLAAELLRSEKEREEHRVVVDMLRETLGPLAARLDVEPAAHVIRLRHIQHLVTLVSGRLREQAGILDLVERLHPTPAVGGAPRELALALLEEEERLDRGWYAGPVGWLDRRGDGEFVVAIRSGVVNGASASLFTGCGIVADSEPAREWEESQVKLRALASALGRLP
ncbi:MAG TPA: isochorismate synthase [Candidatus Limnocylindria bacterium]|nr:isochorismate synthase [Candidatus Limnocylindria bacterium]